MSGLFISFEGIDGSGKSTQAQRITEAVRSAGREVTFVREPGSTLLAERVRAILLDADLREMNSRAELLLYVACRAQLVEETIRPALRTGGVVVSDRFSDSTVAYQGYGRGLGPELAWQAINVATGGLLPDITFLIDVPVDVAASRRDARANDRLEAEERAFHERVRSGFLEIAARAPERVIIVDGTAHVDRVTWEVLRRLRERIPGLVSPPPIDGREA